MDKRQWPGLAELLDGEKESLLAKLREDRAPGAAAEALGRALDRLGYRYGESCPDARLAAEARAMLGAVKNALPLMAAVNDSRDWKREVAGRKGLNLAPMNLALLILGGVLVIAAVLGQFFASGRFGAALGLLRTLLPAILGGGLLFFAGLRAGRPGRKNRKAPEAEIRREYLVDPEDAFHTLRATLVLADADLDALREQAAVAALEQRGAENRGPLSAGESELLSNLIEIAYAHRTDAMAEDAGEMINEIRYFLHASDVELVDYSPEDAAWFELLPAPEAGTLRPAMVKEGKLIRKGLAATK